MNRSSESRGKSPRVLSTIESIFLGPFYEELHLFIALFLLSSGADLFFWAKNGDPVFAVYMAIHGLIICYGALCVLRLFPDKIKKILSIVLIAFGFINLAADSGVHSIMGYGFTQDMVAIVMGTNPSESTEFLSMYINPPMLLFIGAVTLLVIGVLHFSEFFTFLYPKVSNI